jgi:hypothetical protein
MLRDYWHGVRCSNEKPSAAESESGDEDDDDDEDEDALEPSVDQRFFVRSVASLHKVTC